MTFPPPLAATRPRLAIVVDTEEEFDWTRPFSREHRSVRNIQAQSAAHEIYDRLGVVPTYVIGYPVATDDDAIRFFRALKSEGRAEIGAHLHPWVTPPHDERVTRRNSYHCNLPAALERAKIAALTEAIEERFDDRPTIFKAGRHGFGPSTARTLAELGYKVDCSVVPYASFEADGGPSFYRRPDRPFWLDREAQLLEVPVTNAFFGPLAGLGRHIQTLFDSPLAERLHLPGLLARSRLVARARLTPEGVPPHDQCRLLKALVRRGLTTFTLVYHSPSLSPGNTPYVRSRDDLAAFLASIDTVLRYFRDELGGRFTTLSQIHSDQVAMLAATRPQREMSDAIIPAAIETGRVTT